MALTIKQDSAYQGEDWWKWSVWIDGSEEELDAVDHVVYTLHRTFPNPVQKVSDRATRFQLKATGWGSFVIYCKIVLKDGSVLKDSHYLELSYPDGRPTER